VRGIPHARSDRIRAVQPERRPERTEKKMRTTAKHAPPKTTGLLPATLADTQLDHVERMVQYFTHNEDANVSGFDYAYWRKRLRAVAETYDLVASQRKRVVGLLDRLEREALLSQPRRPRA
jgi:hypothetical protein